MLHQQHWVDPKMGWIYHLPVRLTREQAAGRSFLFVGEEQAAVGLLGGSRNVVIVNHGWSLRSLDGGLSSPGTFLRWLTRSGGSRGARPGRGEPRNPTGSQRRCTRVWFREVKTRFVSLGRDAGLAGGSAPSTERVERRAPVPGDARFLEGGTRVVHGWCREELGEQRQGILRA